MTQTNCIVCKDRQVNPQIGKSFCSRVCEHIHWDVTLEFVSPECRKRIADKQHAAIKEYAEKILADLK